MNVVVIRDACDMICAVAEDNSNAIVNALLKFNLIDGSTWVRDKEKVSLYPYMITLSSLGEDWEDYLRAQSIGKLCKMFSGDFSFDIFYVVS